MRACRGDGEARQRAEHRGMQCVEQRAFAPALTFASVADPAAAAVLLRLRFRFLPVDAAAPPFAPSAAAASSPLSASSASALRFDPAATAGAAAAGVATAPFFAFVVPVAAAAFAAVECTSGESRVNSMAAAGGGAAE